MTMTMTASTEEKTSFLIVKAVIVNSHSQKVPKSKNIEV
jgi:hypothetical protein